jgi:hypothetical protein
MWFYIWLRLSWVLPTEQVKSEEMKRTVIYITERDRDSATDTPAHGGTGRHYLLADMVSLNQEGQGCEW